MSSRDWAISLHDTYAILATLSLVLFQLLVLK